jgi:hypothetical protein
MDIKGGDDAKRQRNVRVKTRQTKEKRREEEKVYGRLDSSSEETTPSFAKSDSQEKEKRQEEEVEYTGTLDLENSCIPNVFGKQPCWSIDEHLRYYVQKEQMKSTRVTDISLSIIGDKYIDHFGKWINKLPDWKLWILTDNPEKVRRIVADKRHVIVPYNKPRFNYFDKLLWALDAVIETGRPVLQLDVKRLTYRLHVVEKFIDDTSMVNALYHKPVYDNSCYFLGVWSPGMTAHTVPTVTNHDLRFGTNYWKPILEYMGKDTDKWAPVLEHATLFAMTPEKAKKVRKDLVEIEPIFKKQSLEQTNPYPGVSSGEGLALGWALHNNKVDTRPLLQVQQVTMHNPQDFTHPWDNTEYRERVQPCSFKCTICNDYYSKV